MNETRVQSTGHFPHEEGDGTVTREQLAAHFHDNPEMYHPGLAPHIERHIGKVTVESTRQQPERPTREEEQQQFANGLRMLIDQRKQNMGPYNRHLLIAHYFEEGEPAQALELMEAEEGLLNLFATSVRTGIACGYGEQIAEWVFNRNWGHLATRVLMDELVAEFDLTTLAAYLPSFPAEHLVKKLLNFGQAEFVIEHLDNFAERLDSNEVAADLIRLGYLDLFEQYAPRLAPLAEYVALELLNKEEFAIFERTITQFEPFTEEILPHLGYDDEFITRILINHLDRFTALNAYAGVDQLMRANRTDLIEANIDKFIRLSVGLSSYWVNQGRVDLVVDNFNKFLLIVDADVTEALLDMPDGEAFVAFRLVNFAKQPESVVERLIAAGFTHEVMENLSVFESIPAGLRVEFYETPAGLDILMEHPRLIPIDETLRFAKLAHQHGRLHEYIRTIDYGPINPESVDERVLRLYLSVYGNDRLSSIWLAAYDIKDADWLVPYFIEVGDIAALLAFNLPLSNAAVDQFIEAGLSEIVLRYASHFPSYDFSDLIEAHATEPTILSMVRPEILDSALRKRPGLALQLASFREHVISDWRIMQLAKKAQPGISVWEVPAKTEMIFKNYLHAIDRLPKHQIPEFEQLARELFGNDYRTNILEALLLTQHSVPPAALTEIGVTERGVAGLEQAREIFTRLLVTYRSGELTPADEEYLLEHQAARWVFMAATKFNHGDRKYGQGTDDVLVKKLKHLQAARAENKLPELSAGFVPSETYELHTANNKDFEWPEGAVSRYQTLLKDLHIAVSSLGESGHDMKPLFKALQSAAGEVMAERAQASSNAPEGKKRDNLTARAASLHEYLRDTHHHGRNDGGRFIMNSPVDFRRAFRALEPHVELHPHMRRAVFGWALSAHPDLRRTVSDLPPEPTPEAILTMQEFIDTIVNDQTYQGYFDNKREAMRFRHMSSTKALTEALQLYQSRAEKGKITEIQFVPARGIMLEISGQLADACWADIENSSGKEHPNFTAVLMRARPGKASERYVGSALMIETTDSDSGEKALVLRGTNPIQNYINKVDIPEFYKAVTDYTRQMARAIGAKPVLAIDNHSGGLGTNRPMLFDYMREQADALARVAVTDDDTEFNDYSLKGHTYQL